MLLRLIPFLLVLGIAVPGGAAAQTTRQAQNTEALINWYYAAVYGTGVYTAGDRTVGVVQLPFAYTIRPASAQEWGIKLTLPVSFGFYDFDVDDLVEGNVPQSVSTVSVLPGVELETRPLDNWRLQPFAAVGKGRELTGDASAVLYNFGVKSQLTFPFGRGRFMLGNTFSYAAYDADDDVSHPLTRFITGLNFIFPSNGTFRGRPVDFGLHLIQYLYGTRLAFPLADDVENETRAEVEMGFSFSTRQAIPIGAFGQDLFDFDQVGLVVRVGDNVTGIRLFFSLPY